VVYDSVGADTFMKSLDCLAPFGLLANFGSASGKPAPLDIGVLAAKGSLYVSRPTLFTHISTRERTQAMADELFGVVASGAVKIRIDQRYPLAEAAKAHVDLEARATTGSSVLLP
jgi:NADPH2:quinone reductase